MIFVDSWAWIALAHDNDPYHWIAVQQHRRLQRQKQQYITTNYVLAESITPVFRDLNFTAASMYFGKVMESFRQGRHQLINITPEHFDRAWQLRLKYDDKPDISFVDFTSMVVMQELGINTVFTGDRHFEQVNLGFGLVP